MPPDTMPGLMFTTPYAAGVKRLDTVSDDGEFRIADAMLMMFYYVSPPGCADASACDMPC